MIYLTNESTSSLTPLKKDIDQLTNEPESSLSPLKNSSIYLTKLNNCCPPLEEVARNEPEEEDSRKATFYNKLQQNTTIQAVNN